MRALAVFAVLATLAAPPVQAQNEETLADIRQELTVLYVEVQRLRRELSTTGSPSVSVGGQSVLDRLAAIEAEMQRLTSSTEELEFRINRIVTDGTNRIGDLEFRLVELEGGDLSQLGETTTLGGASPSGTGETPVPDRGAQVDLAVGGGAQLAVGEEQDFRVAQQALADGDYQRAADQFTQFQEKYPGGPLAAGADLGRGQALEALGETQMAARAYLQGFSADPTGTLAPQSLFLLGRSLGALNQVSEACLTLGEVELRFPSDPAVGEARAEMQRLGCS
ncbi:MAG: tol-pal system protein YbgF [Roseobacter sp.]